MPGVTIRIILDTRAHRRAPDGTYPVVLRVRKGTFKDYAFIHDHEKIRMTPENFARTQQERPRDPWATWRRRFSAEETRAREVLARLQVFTHDQFQALWEDTSDRENVFDWFAKHVEAQKTATTRRTYQHALEKLRAFYPKSKLLFPDLTKDFLSRYIAHLGNASTAATYLAPLKTACQMAEDAGAIHRQFNPFHGFDVPTTERREDMVFSRAEIQLIASASIQQTTKAWARDMCILMYLLSGIRPVDLFNLTWSQIDREARTITYRPQKTRGRKKNKTPVVLHLIPAAWELLMRHSRQLGSDRVLPGTPTYRGIQKYTTMNNTMNQQLRKLLPELGLPYRPTYAFRHTVLSHLRDMGVSSAIAARQGGTSEAQLESNYFGELDPAAARAVALALGW